MLKVGLTTSSVIPRPAATPWTNCVFPAPKSPESTTTSPSWRYGASVWPSFLVASVEVVFQMYQVRSPVGADHTPCARRTEQPDNKRTKAHFLGALRRARGKHPIRLSRIAFYVPPCWALPQLAQMAANKGFCSPRRPPAPRFTL